MAPSRFPRLAAFIFALTLTAAPLVHAQAPAPAGSASEDDYDDYDDYAPVSVYDPFEGFNRRVFVLNDWLYVRVLTPAVYGYAFVVRPPVNTASGKFYDNVRTG